MFGILVSAFNTILAFLMRSLIVKFVFYFALYFVTTEFLAILVTHLPNSSILSGAFSSIPSTVWYFLDVFQISAGIPMILAAYITRFMIRRIPIIG
jgi:hypothetical protein